MVNTVIGWYNIKCLLLAGTHKEDQSNCQVLRFVLPEALRTETLHAESCTLGVSEELFEL